MTRRGESAPGTGWGNPSHPLHRPAAGGQPQPYVEKNLEALKHGALSVRATDTVAGELVAAAVADVPYLSETKYRATLQAWARAEARVRLLDAWLDGRGLLEEDGEVRAASNFLLTCEKQAARLRGELGLTPASAATIGRAVSAAQLDVAQFWARMADEEETDSV